MKWTDIFFSAALLLAAFSVAGASIYISSYRNLTGLENALLQAFSLAFGLMGSFHFGKQSSKNALRELVTPCSGLMFPDTLLRDNTSQLMRCQYESEENV